MRSIWLKDGGIKLVSSSLDGITAVGAELPDRR